MIKRGSIKWKIKRLFDFIISSPFFIGKSFLRNVFLAYQPDSFDLHFEHTEFNLLFKKFIKKNKRNNSGDISRLWSLILNIKQIILDNVKGDFAEVGVWKGNTAAVLAFYANKHNRKVYLFDTFKGFNKKDIKGIDSDKSSELKIKNFHDTSITIVKDNIGDDYEACEIVEGYFPESLNENHNNKTFAIVHLDCDLYEPTRSGLEFFYTKMSPGGIFILHDYSNCSWTGSKKAIDEFILLKKENLILMPDKSGSAFFRKNK